MLLSNAIRFQKTLALAASASNIFEAEAAELAARRLMEQLRIDPTIIPNSSLYNRMNFADNELLIKLRAEWRAQHPTPTSASRVKAKRLKPESFALFDQDDDTSAQDVYQSPSIPFNIAQFRRQTATNSGRKAPDKNSNNVNVTPKMLQKIHAMIGDGIAPVLIRRTFGLTKGQIAGIKGRYDQQHSQHQQATPAAAGNAGD